MIKKSRFVLAIGLVLALGVGSLAFADGASNNTAFVDGGVTPKKLDKKKYKPVNLFSGVRTEVTGGVNGLQANPDGRVHLVRQEHQVRFQRRRCLHDAAAEREHPGPGEGRLPAELLPRFRRS